MAQIAHLILSHQNPDAVARLVSRISHPDNTVYVHVDGKESIRPFAGRFRNRDDIRLIRHRTAIAWGAYSMVAATLRAMEEILADGNYDFINLLSESDYPLANASEFHEFLGRHPGKSFMEMLFSGSPWWEEAQQKTNNYHLVDYSFPGKYAIQKILNTVLPKRTLPDGLNFTGRSQWMTLSAKHVQYVLKYEAAHPKAIRFFEHTWGPDEFFFQTILHSSPYRDELIPDSLRYIDWSQGNVSPKMLTSNDFDSLATSGKFFARKFNPSVDAAVLNRIDKELLQTP